MTNQTKTVKIECPRCLGHGVLDQFLYVEQGRCFKCLGAGTVTVFERRSTSVAKGRSTCRDCGEGIVWFKSRKGKFYACNSTRRNDFHSSTCTGPKPVETVETVETFDIFEPVEALLDFVPRFDED